MVVNNFSSGTSISSNCEKDVSTPLLNDVHEMFLNAKEKPVKNIEDETQNYGGTIIFKDTEAEIQIYDDLIIFDPEIAKVDWSDVEDEAISYIACAVCRKLLEKTKCSKCIDNLQTSALKPSQTFMQTFKILFNVASQIIPDLCSEKLLKIKLISQFNNEMCDEIGCDEHKEHVTKQMKEYVAYYAIVDFCKKINSLLSGKIKEIPVESNHMVKLALDFRAKGKHIGKHSDKLTS